MTKAIFLVVILSPGEAVIGQDFRKNRAVKSGVKFYEACLRFFCLIRRMREDQRRVLAGPGPTCRVMRLPEDVQEDRVGNHFRVEIDLDRFCMIPYVVVGWIRLRAARIANTRSHHPLKAPEPGVRTPESAKRKGGRFQKTIVCFFVHRPFFPPSSMSRFSPLPGLRFPDGPGNAAPGRSARDGPPFAGLP